MNTSQWLLAHTHYVRGFADVQSISFRLVWAAVTVLLLAALVWVVRLAWLSHPTTASPVRSSQVAQSAAAVVAPQTTRVAESVTAITPTLVATATNPTGTTEPNLPVVELGNRQRIQAGGFAFQPPISYTLAIAGNEVTMLAANRADAARLLLTSAEPLSPNTPPTSTITGVLPALLAGAALALDFSFAQPETVTVADTLGVQVDLTGVGPGREQAWSGRAVLVDLGAERRFVMVGLAPQSEWPQADAHFAAVSDSLQFFVPRTAVLSAATAVTTTASTAAATPAARSQAPSPSVRPTATGADPTLGGERNGHTASSGPWSVFSNANLANAVTAALNTIWVATDGGVIAWNKNNGAVTKYTTLDGLAANRSTTVVNCPLRGFGVVFGSDAGLQIFDIQSNSWKLLNSANSSMSFDDVATLYCDTQNRFLIIGYKQHGLDIFDANHGNWRYIGQNEGLQNNLVEAIGVAGDRLALWISSGLGITVLPATGEPIFYDEANSPLETNRIHRIVVAADGVVWLGAQDALYKVAGEEWTIYDQRAVLASQFPSGALTGLAVMEDGTLWIGSSRGEVCHFDPVRVQCQSFFSSEPGMVAGNLTSLAIGADSAIYYTTAGGGVSMYLGGRWRAFVIPDEPLLGNEIHSLAQTQDGNLWIATERGIQAINPISGTVMRQFTRDNSALQSATREVLHADPEGGVWFGAVGVSYFNGLSWKTYSAADGLAGSLVQAIATDDQGRTWFGTDAGLSIWNSSTFFNLTRENSLPSDNILALLADDNSMWISAADGGLFRFEKNQLQLYTTENSDLPAGSITTIAKTADGALLLGHSRGLVRFEDGRVTNIPALNGYAITAVATQADGVVWVGARSDGLFYFDGERWTSAPDLLRPPAAQITAILVDQQGKVWIGAGNGGLLRYAP